MTTSRSKPRGLFLVCLCWASVCLLIVQGRTFREEQDSKPHPDDGLPRSADPEEEMDEEMSDMFDYSWPVLCPPNHWYSKHQEDCIVCSPCPVDQFITRPCYKFYDTKCAPLYAFPDHLLSSKSDGGGEMRPLVPKGEDKTRGRPRHGAAEWRPAELALGVILIVLVTALLVTSVALCVVWRKQRKEASIESGEKLVYSNNPTPTDQGQLVCSYCPVNEDQLCYHCPESDNEEKFVCSNSLTNAEIAETV